jgi:hypothetical protein
MWVFLWYFGFDLVAHAASGREMRSTAAKIREKCFRPVSTDVWLF